jgi:hypothetical protein
LTIVSQRLVTVGGRLSKVSRRSPLKHADMHVIGRRQPLMANKSTSVAKTSGKLTKPSCLNPTGPSQAAVNADAAQERCDHSQRVSGLPR